MSAEDKKPRRVTHHPILDPRPGGEVTFTFNGRELKAKKGEVISSALFAEGITVFGHHPEDGSPQGMFCANGQCSQCLVIADGVCVKSCMTPVREGMAVRSCEGLPELPAVDGVDGVVAPGPVPVVKTQVLIVGAGPAGLSAAQKLAELGIGGIIVDDKADPGGKLTLQTHAFFGSVSACYAGTRGIEIGKILTDKVAAVDAFEIWSDATAVGVFVDGKVGIVRGNQYILVRPEALLVAAGAREKNIAFPGCDLPGVYGAGAFQTLLNRDLVLPTSRLLIVGGGNVGLIAAYHALQAGIEVAGILEALPLVGGYKVHLDKIRRAGVPVWLSHTVLRAEGKDKVERAVLVRLDKNFRPVAGTRKTLDVDTILIAVGLAPIGELHEKAGRYGIPSWAAGDALEIAEASAAMFSGKITALKIAKHLGKTADAPRSWIETEKALKSRPGKTYPLKIKEAKRPFQPVIRCVQEIPCNPCVEVCPLGHIQIPSDRIVDLPRYSGGECLGCGRCVLICPGLAITLLFRDYDPDKKHALVIIPYEMDIGTVHLGGRVTTVDMEGREIGEGIVKGIKRRPEFNRRVLVAVQVPWRHRLKVAGFASHRPVIQPAAQSAAAGAGKDGDDGDAVICRCCRIKKSDIVKEIRRGVRDINELKATLRTGMGACGGKTCTPLIERIFAGEGIETDKITPTTGRPFVTEVPMSVFAGEGAGESDEE